MYFTLDERRAPVISLLLWIAVPACSQDDGGPAASSKPDASLPAATVADAAGPDASDPNAEFRVRIIDSVSNHTGRIEACVHRGSAAGRASPITREAYPGGMTYREATGYFTLKRSDELKVTSSLGNAPSVSFLLDFFEAPIEECPIWDFKNDPRPDKYLFQGQAFFRDPERRFVTVGFYGAVIPPPEGEPVAPLCGMTFDRACTFEQGGGPDNPPFLSIVHGDDVDDVPIADAVKVTGSNLAVGLAPFDVTFCWDPDGAGPNPPIVAWDLRNDVQISYRRMPPMTSGIVTAFGRGGVSCDAPGDAPVLASLGLPDSQPPPGSVATLDAGAVGTIVLFGQVTKSPSRSDAAPRLALLPRAR